MLQDDDAVYDCMQNLFIKLWVKRERLPDIANLRNYLIFSLRNTITDFRLAENRYEKVEINGEHHFDLKFSVESEYIRKEDSSEKALQLSKAMNDLTPRQKEFIYLKYFEEMDYNEIAEIMDMSIKATYKLNARALEALKQILKIDKALILAILLSLKQ